jgi:hypothetical protein
LYRDRFHIHQQWQRVRGDIVGPLRRAARELAQIRIFLSLEHRLRERGVRLIHRNHIRARRVSATAGGERGVRPVHLDVAHGQDAQHVLQTGAIRLLRR